MKILQRPFLANRTTRLRDKTTGLAPTMNTIMEYANDDYRRITRQKREFIVSGSDNYVYVCVWVCMCVGVNVCLYVKCYCRPKGQHKCRATKVGKIILKKRNNPIKICDFINKRNDVFDDRNPLKHVWSRHAHYGFHDFAQCTTDRSSRRRRLTTVI